MGRTSRRAAGRDKGAKNIKSAATPPTADPIRIASADASFIKTEYREMVKNDRAGHRGPNGDKRNRGTIFHHG